jgi:DNA-binding transcriptional regulator WhiA
MSFSGKIKEELAEHVAKARHCNLAELTAILHMCGEFEEDKNYKQKKSFAEKMKDFLNK